MRDELKNPKNLIGAILILIAVLLAIWAIAENKSDTHFFIAMGSYLIGMLLILVNNKNNKIDKNNKKPG